jgi:hypothetical protein
MTMEEPGPPADTEAEPATWPRRTPVGAAWRGAVVLVFTLAGIPASAWLGTELSAYEPRFVSGPPIGLGLMVLVLYLGWLRVRDAFVIPTLWSVLAAAYACSYLLDKGYVSPHHPYPTGPPWPTISMSLLAAGTVGAVVTIAWGTVSGYRRPRPFQPKKDGREAASAS